MYSINLTPNNKNSYSIIVRTVGENINVFDSIIAKEPRASPENFRAVIEDLCYSLIEFYDIKNRHVRGFEGASFMALNLIDKRLSLGYKDSLNGQDSGVYFEGIN